MKKQIFTIFTLLSSVYICATTYMRVKTDDGEIVRYEVKHITEVDFEEEPDPYVVTESGKIGEYTYVDLGLKSGTKWATCNVGAGKYYEVGTHFSWGETLPDDTLLSDCYSWSQYKWGGLNDLTKYVTMSSWGTVDNIATILPEDDAASQNLGDGWRMPSVKQQQELADGCDWTFIEDFNNTGVSGMYGISKKNDNAIFLPVTGYRARAAYGLCGKGYGWYWSADLNQSDNGTAYLMKFTPDGFTSMSQGRHDGMIVRAVVVNEEDEIAKDTAVVGPVAQDTAVTPASKDTSVLDKADYAPLKFVIASDTTAEFVLGDYSGLDTIIIPSKVMIDTKEYTVVSIGCEALATLSKLRYVELPSTLTTIRDYSFWHCGIFSLVIPSSVTTIERHAFEESYLRNITIPSSVTVIGESAFENCTYLDVKIDNSKENVTVGEKAFEGCKSVTYLKD